MEDEDAKEEFLDLDATSGDDVVCTSHSRATSKLGRRLSHEKIELSIPLYILICTGFR